MYVDLGELGAYNSQLHSVIFLPNLLKYGTEAASTAEDFSFCMVF
jgi:hypothetical protein